MISFQIDDDCLDAHDLVKKGKKGYVIFVVEGVKPPLLILSNLYKGI